MKADFGDFGLLAMICNSGWTDSMLMCELTNFRSEQLKELLNREGS